MSEQLTGHLRKMPVELPTDASEPVSYQLLLDDECFPLNAWLGRQVHLTFTGRIHCVYCGRKTSKSFNQGYCFPCFKKLARCDSCIVKPEKCHFHLGTCREPEWAETYCMQSHYVYLANSSGVKVGITRGDQVPTRWIDQGASQALPMYRVDSRYIAGLAEVLFKERVSDKTNWRAMLKGVSEPQNLHAVQDELQSSLASGVDQLRQEHGLTAVDDCKDADVVSIHYPVQRYPQKIVSANFDKQPEVGGTLTGIKGQYLIFGDTVINIRKFSGYEVSVSVD